MSNIVDLAKTRLERAAHCQGTAYCTGCRHEWQGVWPVGTVDLECPACGSLRGKSKTDVLPPPDSAVWECSSCGSQLFYLLQDRVHCPGCGWHWAYGDLT